MFAIMILLTFVVLLIIFINPKIGTFLIWPILFTYPHSWWYYHEFLPLNMGVDDLFCIFLFLSILVRHNLMDGKRIRFGYAFWVVVAFTVVGVVANTAGAFEEIDPFRRSLYLKDILKNGIYFGLFYAILHCIDDERDLKIQFTMFSVAAMIGAILVILQNFFPYQMEIFATPRVTTVGFALTYESRGAGAFMNPNAAACILSCALVMTLASLRMQRTLFSKIAVYLIMFILLIGILFTRSRAGLLMLIGTLGLMAIISQSRTVVWLAIIAGVVVALAFTGMRELYKERIAQVYDPMTKTWGANVLGRIETWAGYFRTATLRNYILGQGPKQALAKNDMESHSAYVSLITVYGLGGVIWAISALIKFMKMAVSLKGFPDPLIAAVSAACFWALIGWGIYANTSDAITSYYPRYLLFYIVVLIDRAYYFAQQQQWQSYCENFYGDQLQLYPQ
jgi:hypothetical protein